eukprot:CAMPEP_0206540282 /NCGR_PEP_ID=MMETSP0325_2-20121206/8899_1 /ASSEMBLY_ACC=CAM_ASM_000347 /TAXON_ID=2866 /ORGANISM="Crypthecodinium cohnii, Strain Seligo" /LENGTH=192 /DNA_ID=CAMNT_0054037949 /DNA_START=404 /DNA_END=979 /DNA_ORIENTATION=-
MPSGNTVALSSSTSVGDASAARLVAVAPMPPLLQGGRALLAGVEPDMPAAAASSASCWLIASTTASSISWVNSPVGFSLTEFASTNEVATFLALLATSDDVAALPVLVAAVGELAAAAAVVVAAAALEGVFAAAFAPGTAAAAAAAAAAANCAPAGPATTLRGAAAVGAARAVGLAEGELTKSAALALALLW